MKLCIKESVADDNHEVYKTDVSEPRSWRKHSSDEDLSSPPPRSCLDSVIILKRAPAVPEVHSLSKKNILLIADIQYIKELKKSESILQFPFHKGVQGFTSLFLVRKVSECF